MTKDEAEQEAENKVKNIALNFCPLINGTCNPKCVCYNKVRIEESKNIVSGNLVYYVRGGYCDNDMFHCE